MKDGTAVSNDLTTSVVLSPEGITVAAAGTVVVVAVGVFEV